MMPEHQKALQQADQTRDHDPDLRYRPRPSATLNEYTVCVDWSAPRNVVQTVIARSEGEIPRLER